jgi:MFS superfamily sulfate permease-like transporter
MVALCLSIALSIASGGTPMMGLQAAIYGPFVAGAFGGSAYNILGPAGALVNILNKESAEWGPEILPAMAIFGGLMGLCVFYAAGHKFVNEIDEQVAVLEGFSLAVAIVIGGGQLNNALGLRGLTRYPEFYNNVGETFKNIGNA